MSKKTGEAVAHMMQAIFQEKWNDVFLVDGSNDEKYSYEQFFGMIINGKSFLKEYGAEKQKVVLLLDNSVELLTLYFSALLAGITVIPVDPQKSENEIEEILTLSGADFILSSKEIQHPHTGFDQIRDKLSQPTAVNEEMLSVFETVDYEKVFSISFTSGSTGVPKGVMHSFSNLCASALAFRDCFALDHKNVFLHNLPMTYMAGMLNLIIVPFFSKSKIVLGDRFSIASILRFWELPIKHNINTFFFIPTIVSLLLKVDRGNDGAKYCEKTTITAAIGTAPLKQKDRIQFKEKYGVTLYESYGLSETLFLTSNSPQYEKIKGVGRELNGVQLSFDDDSEIVVETPWNFLGYYHDGVIPETIPHFPSGDLGNKDEEGFISIIGRKKDLIIKGGVNIMPAKIDQILQKEQFFEDFVIMGILDDTIGEKVVCFYLSRKEVDLNMRRKINELLVNTMNKSYQIDEFSRVKSIPKNINGKTDKLKLKQEYLSP